MLAQTTRERFPERVLITGGSRGIGAACVRAFAARGCRVAFLYAKSDEAAAALAAETGALAVRTDVADREAVFAAVGQVAAWMGGIECLVNNAGIALGSGSLPISLRRNGRG